MSQVLKAFQAELKQEFPNWETVYTNLNGLNMEEMLKGLAALKPAQLAPVWDNRTRYLDRFGFDRIGYAVDVVRKHRLPLVAPGDLRATGQVETAWQFLQHRPVDFKTNTEMGDNTVEQLRHIMPRLPAAQAERFIRLLNQAMGGAAIITRLRTAAFLAQLAEESVELTAMEEFASGAEYEGRADLGNTHPGDGKRYKGRGPIQLTGRANYRATGRDLGLDLEANPAQAATPEVGFRVAGHFWRRKNLNPLADRGEFRAITRRINGGLNGIAVREMYYRRALHAF